MNKKLCIGLLACANLVLFTGIVLFSTSPPAAYAQPTGLNSNYMMVAGEIQNKYDALYIIDLRTRLLHAFYVDKSNQKFVYADTRDLERDFRNNRN